MKKILFVLIGLVVSLSSYSQYMGEYTESDNEFNECLDVNNLFDWEIKEYFYQYIDKGIDDVILYRANGDRAYENLRNAPSLLLSTMIISDTASYISGNKGYFIIDSLSFRPINTKSSDIKQLIITVEYYDCNENLLYDLKTGKSTEQFIIKNIKGRGDGKTWEYIFDKIDILFRETLYGFTYKSNFYNKRKSSCKIKNIKATYINGKIETRWYSVKSTWFYEKGFNIEEFLKNSPFSPLFKFFKYKHEQENDKKQSTAINEIESGNDESVYSSAARMPIYPKGDAGIMIHLSRNIIYPQAAADNNIQGKVVVQFVVEKDGRVGEVKVVRSVDKDLDAEAIRVIKTLENFKPALNAAGDPVRVWYTLPVIFKLHGIKY